MTHRDSDANKKRGVCQRVRWPGAGVQDLPGEAYLPVKVSSSEWLVVSDALRV